MQRTEPRRGRFLLRLRLAPGCARLCGAGDPDGVVSLDLARDLPAGKALKPEELQSLLVPNTYDPTNGTTSAGDIFKYSSGTSF